MNVFKTTLLCTLLISTLAARTSAEEAYTPLSGASLYQSVEHYAGLGEHRTGTATDHNTSRWLANQLQQLGFSLEEQPFTVQQYFPSHQQLSIGNKRFDVFPHWLPVSTHATVSAPLAALTTQTPITGKIAYVSPQDAGLWYRLQPSQLAQQAKAKGAIALVIAAPHPSGDIYATNAAPPYLDQPIALPTVMIAAKHHQALQQALTDQQPISLTSLGQTKTVQASNILGRFPAKPIVDAPWIVVSTPSSGWFQCAGERGSGVALWLDMARYISQQEHNQLNWLFVANSGHELNMIGAHHSLAITPPPEQVKLWLHLGASIAARQWQRAENGTLQPIDKVHDYNYFYSASESFKLFDEALNDVPGLTLLALEQLNRSHSELGKIAQRGYRAAGIVGSHRFFHTPGDTPAVTSETLLAPYGQAMQRLIDQLLATPANTAKEK